MRSDTMKKFVPEGKMTERIVAAVKSIANQAVRSMAQVALAWLRQRSVPIIPIIGARKLPQLQDNLASLELSLAADQLKALDEASRIYLGFPQEIFTRGLRHGLRSGGMADRIIA